MDDSRVGIYEFGEYRLDAVKRLLRRNGRTLALMPKAFDTLLYLVQNSGRILGKDELMHGVWAGAFVEENNLSQNVSILRRVLGEKRGENRFIATIPGKGFKFVAQVHQSESENGVTDERVESIAVLPFTSLVGEKRHETLELGMADTLISRLGSAELIVRPLSSVLRYQSNKVDSSHAGRELGVDAVLDGTILISGEHLRVSARLVRTRNSKQLWAGKFDEKFTDIFMVQDVISEHVAEALQIGLAGKERTPSTDNVEAYQYYVRGCFHAEMMILPEVQKAIEYFKSAIALDPGYALAYAGLAYAYLRLVLVNNVPTAEVMTVAKTAALRAIELAPSNADVFGYLTWLVFWYEWDWRRAEKYCLRAIELNPNNSFVRMVYAHLLSNLSRHSEAIVQIRRARELDPTSIMNQAVEGQILLIAEKLEAALETLRRIKQMNPNFWLSYLFLSRIYSKQDMHEKAIGELEKALEIFPLNMETIALKGYSLAQAGKTNEARAVLAKLHNLSEEHYVAPYVMAIMHNGLGETAKALDYLEKAYAEKNVLMVFLKVDPKWNNLRNEPRFLSMLRAMNF
jgi:DNA-binding winged helix-turn-helix (wHTH) protein/tetratricopeptide (TPR) repeat protein